MTGNPNLSSPMPFSIPTRLLGALIAAGFACALLAPSPEAMAWGKAASPVLALLLPWFTFRAVREAAPFDDRAFHRTLPVSDALVLWKIVRLHLWVVGAAGAAVALHALHFNLTWPTAVWGMAAVALPLLALSSYAGLLGSLLIPWQRRSGWIVFFLAVLPASLWFAGTLPHSEARWPGGVPAFGLHRVSTTILLVFPALWWLAAVRRRALASVVLAAATAVLAPWISLLDPLEWSERELARRDPIAAGAYLEPLPERDGAFAFHGLTPGEFVRMQTWDGDRAARRSAWADFAAVDDGSLLDGSLRLVEVLAQALPRSATPDPASLLAGATKTASTYPGDYGPALPYPNFPPVADASNPGRVYRWIKLTEVPAEDKSRLRLPDGGVMILKPSEGLDGGFSHVVELCFDRLAAPSLRNQPRPGPAVIAIGGDGRCELLSFAAEGPFVHFMTTRLRLETRRMPLADAASQRKREWFRSATFHVFWAESRGRIRFTGAGG